VDKQWNPDLEQEVLARWQAERLYRFDPHSKKPFFVVDNPPPYPSGTWHIGAVAHYSLIDMVVRFERMTGSEVLYPWGLDRNGINIELTVERATKKPLHRWDREEFIERCRQEIQPIGDALTALARRVGLSCDFEDHAYLTDSPEYRRITQAVFIDLFNRGLVYVGTRPAFYCTGCGTSIAEADIEYREDQGTLSTVAFPLVDGGEIPIATTRPELLCSCQTVIVHPEDPRFTAMVGKRVRIPLVDREVEVRAHPSAHMEFGTGAAMICSYGDTTDIQLFRELGLKEIQAIGTDGRMTAAAGNYAGLKVKEARQRAVEDLQAAGQLRKQEPVTHKTPVCERSKTPIEFIPMEDLYLKQVDVLPKLRERVAAMEFFPPRSRQLLLNWIDSVTIDWPISRRRFFHTEIPLWYCTRCSKAITPPPGPYYRPWKDPAPFDACPGCGGREFRGEDRVFDTWMDSSNTNLVASQYLKDEAFFKGNFPTHLRPQGRDIVRNWLFYTTLKSHYVMDREPFHKVLVTGMGLDKHGRAMHKSTGNVIEPGPVLARHGADAFRFWAASETNVGDDFRIDEEKIAGAKKFLSKLWNVARFISSFEEPHERPELRPADRWILGELHSLAEACWEGYRQYNLFGPANRCRDFLWNLFAAHYMEMVKSRAYQGDVAAVWTLHACLRDLLRFLAPILPFVTDKVWSSLYGGSVHRETLPGAHEGWKTDLTDLTEAVIAFNSEVWNAKKLAKKSLNEPVAGISLPTELEPFRAELVAMHRLQ